MSNYNYIIDNAYMILGLSPNLNNKEFSNHINKIKAYLKVGKQYNYKYDKLSPVKYKRDENIINNLKEFLTDYDNKFYSSLFVYYDMSDKSHNLLDKLKTYFEDVELNLKEIKSIEKDFEKEGDYYSLINAALICIYTNDFNKALSLYIKLKDQGGLKFFYENTQSDLKLFHVDKILNNIRLNILFYIDYLIDKDISLIQDTTYLFIKEQERVLDIGDKYSSKLKGRFKESLEKKEELILNKDKAVSQQSKLYNLDSFIKENEAFEQKITDLKLKNLEKEKALSDELLHKEKELKAALAKKDREFKNSILEKEKAFNNGLLHKEKELKETLAKKELELKETLLTKEKLGQAELLKKEQEIQSQISKKDNELQAILLQKERALHEDLLKKEQEIQNTINQKDHELQVLLLKKERTGQEELIRKEIEIQEKLAQKDRELQVKLFKIDQDLKYKIANKESELKDKLLELEKEQEASLLQKEQDFKHKLEELESIHQKKIESALSLRQSSLQDSDLNTLNGFFDLSFSYETDKQRAKKLLNHLLEVKINLNNLKSHDFLELASFIYVQYKDLVFILNKKLKENIIKEIIFFYKTINLKLKEEIVDRKDDLSEDNYTLYKASNIFKDLLDYIFKDSKSPLKDNFLELKKDSINFR